MHLLSQVVREIVATTYTQEYVILVIPKYVAHVWRIYVYKRTGFEMVATINKHTDMEGLASAVRANTCRDELAPST